MIFIYEIWREIISNVLWPTSFSQTDEIQHIAASWRFWSLSSPTPNQNPFQRTHNRWKYAGFGINDRFEIAELDAYQLANTPQVSLRSSAARCPHPPHSAFRPRSAVHFKNITVGELSNIRPLALFMTEQRLRGLLVHACGILTDFGRPTTYFKLCESFSNARI